MGLLKSDFPSSLSLSPCVQQHPPWLYRSGGFLLAVATSGHHSRRDQSQKDQLASLYQPHPSVVVGKSKKKAGFNP